MQAVQYCIYTLYMSRIFWWKMFIVYCISPAIFCCCLSRCHVKYDRVEKCEMRESKAEKAQRAESSRTVHYSERMKRAARYTYIYRILFRRYIVYKIDIIQSGWAECVFFWCVCGASECAHAQRTIDCIIMLTLTQKLSVLLFYFSIIIKSMRFFSLRIVCVCGLREWISVRAIGGNNMEYAKFRFYFG